MSGRRGASRRGAAASAIDDTMNTAGAVWRNPYPEDITRDVAMGIDVGSHRSRAAIRGHGISMVVNSRASFTFSGTCYPGDFSSYLYVFGGPDDTLYLPNEEDPDRESMSAKYAPYILANASDNVLAEYSLVNSIMERKNDEAFRELLKRGLGDLIRAIRQEVLCACKTENLRIARIGVTIPVQWGLEFETVYRSAISSAFPDLEAEVYFYTEIEALARYLFKHYQRNLDPRHEYTTMMFLDFGGHCMNGSCFAIARNKENPEKSGFFRLGRAFGAGGGSEVWEYYVDQHLRDLYQKATGDPIPSDIRTYFITRFRSQKGVETAKRSNIQTYCKHPRQKRCWKLNLTREGIDELWEKAMEGPLRAAQRELNKLSKMVQQGRAPSPLVVITGGTTLNPAVREELERMCAQLQLPLKCTETDAFSIPFTYSSAKVAQAAAYLANEAITVAQFFGRGAAIGLQMHQAPISHLASANVPWDNAATVLLDQLGEGYTTVEVQNGDQFRLICDPFFGTLSPDQQSTVAAERSYDMLTLGPRDEGTWSFALSLEGANNEMELVLKQAHRRSGTNVWVDEECLRLPLYFDGSSGCVHVGSPHKTLEELGLDLPSQEVDEDEEMSDA